MRDAFGALAAGAGASAGGLVAGLSCWTVDIVEDDEQTTQAIASSQDNTSHLVTRYCMRSNSFPSIVVFYRNSKAICHT